MKVHPSGDVAYSPADDPEDPVTANDLTTTGILHVLGIAPSGITTLAKAKLPRNGAVMAIDPGGRFLVVGGNVYDVDPKSGNPSVHSYVLMTATLDAAGRPSANVLENVGRVPDRRPAGRRARGRRALTSSRSWPVRRCRPCP